jgi:hypothetical protein
MSNARAFAGDVLEAEYRRPAFGRELIAGVRAGQVAGLAMALVLMAIFSVFLNKSPFYPIQVIAASVLGGGTLRQLDARTLVVGVLVHQLGPALAWGVVFGFVVWVFKPRRSLALMMWGLVVGVLSQIVDVYVLLPLLSETLSGRRPLLEPVARLDLWAQVPIAASWLAHLVFGFALSIYPWKYDPVAHSFD